MNSLLATWMSTNKTKYSNNNYFMKLALNKAHEVIGNTKENPAVGCVIVKKKTVIASASTSINGRQHAEHNAIKKAGNKIKNADLYVINPEFSSIFFEEDSLIGG